MKKLIVCLLMGLFLGGCYSTIAQVENRWGPPARVEQRDDTIIYYYHFYKVGGRIITYRGIGVTSAEGGWYTVEITTNKEGKILSKRKYWMQPKVEPTSPTAPTIEQPKEQ